MKFFAKILAWTGLTLVTLLISLATYLNLANLPQPSYRPKATQAISDATTTHAITPEVLGAFTYSVKTEDAIPEIIKNYLKKYNSPLLPHTDVLVSTAREYRLDPRLLVAIAQQESNLCKKIPENSHNCWGWGIHSRGTLRFKTYPEAIKAVTKGLALNYIGQGLVTPNEIMGIYTPLSDGSWARGVQQFLNEMQ